MGGQKILIVDDEEALAMMLKMRLESAGYETLEARDGQEGLEKARKEKPDLIILDLMLPKLDGYNVCKMLKSDEKYKNIPIIILTGSVQVLDKKLGKEVGVNAYMTKPFEPDVLLAKIQELLS